MRQPFRILIVLTAALVVGSPQVFSIESGPDAGAGVDAPNKRAWALALPGYGTFDGTLILGDQDWYRVEESLSGARCVQTAVTSNGALDQTLRVNTGASVSEFTFRAFGPAETRAGVAVPSLQRTHVGLVYAGATSYTWSIGSIGLPTPSVGDALTGDDAGATLAGAIPVSRGCIQGSVYALPGVPDQLDLFSFSVAADDVIVYSLATPGAVHLELRNEVGQAVGNAVASGQTAGFHAPAAGTYYLAAVAAPGASNAGYLLGLSLGPDPGNGCRPHCYLST